ncbi:MAG: LPS export ABC transporter periplasmic protein LptC [Gammaproteobacteria bacterium]|nr:LPS export ABC transporter periplasmic protein LptC [Gammaproteobacteria bacterium]
MNGSATGAMVRRNGRAWLLLALLAIVAGLSFLLRARYQDESRPPAAVARVADYYLVDMERRKHDAAGRLRSVLRAARLEHFADDDTATLVHPSLEIYNDNDWSWLVQAESGWSNGDGTEVLLHGPVEIWRRAADGAVRIHVSTSELRVLPDRQYAETDRAATIRESRSTTTGIGLRANLAENRVEILKQVVIQYDRTE